MDILRLITQTAEDRGFSREFMVEAMKETLTAVVQVDFGEEAACDVVVSDSSGSVEVYLLKKVVNKVTNPATQILIKDAQILDEQCKLNDYIRVKFQFQTLSRNAIAMAKNMIVQKIKDKEKEKVQQKYITKIGEIETGTVQKVDTHELIIKLKDAEGIMPTREQIPGENYYQGNLIKAYVLNVTPGGRVLLSRTHPNFLKKLFEQEVPEIQEKIVEIKLAARIPGIRAKIAVASNNPKVDPIGACVGVKGTRIQVVVKELNNERIDVIQYTSESIVLVSRALSGVKILYQDSNSEQGKAILVVKDDELPKAIGKSGQNVMLASKLTGVKIDIMSEKEYKIKGVVFIPGISESIKETLIANGLFTTADILNKGIDGLAKIQEIGEHNAEKIYELARKLM
ncbi:MAG: transcription termination factor NusA [Candidatus Stahlbacteria bacterium]|nr:transcription termination factor NusA [Candidatus Stahlbacteria bacterium]